jgi:hypothetical protein
MSTNQPATIIQSDGAIPARHMLPKLAYHAALASYFFLQDGTIHNVGTCDTTFLYHLVELCTPKWGPLMQESLMQAINDENDRAGRWYIVLTLSESKGVHVPIFATEDEAASVVSFLHWCNSLPLLFQKRVLGPIEAGSP